MNEEIEMTGKAQQENEIKPAKQSILKINKLRRYNVQHREYSQ